MESAQLNQLLQSLNEVVQAQLIMSMGLGFIAGLLFFGFLIWLVFVWRG